MKLYIVKSDRYHFEVSFDDRTAALQEFNRLFDRFDDAKIECREIGRTQFNSEARREFLAARKKLDK